MQKLDDADLLFKVVQRVGTMDLHPDTVTNHEMGLVFEELIRKFAESSASKNGSSRGRPATAGRPSAKKRAVPKKPTSASSARRSSQATSSATAASPSSASCASACSLQASASRSSALTRASSAPRCRSCTRSLVKAGLTLRRRRVQPTAISTRSKAEARALLKADFPDLKDKQIKELLSQKTWTTQKALFDKAASLAKIIGPAQHNDFNEFGDVLEKAEKSAKIKLDAKERKQLVDAVSWTNPSAEPVVSKVLKSKADPMYGAFEYKGKVVSFKPDSKLRDSEDVPLPADTARGAKVDEENEAYFQREVAPHVADAWIDATKKDPRDEGVGIVGYEIPFNRHFYQYEPPRSLEEIDADLDILSREIMEMLREVSLEQAIIDDLQGFMLEHGKGFAFVARQKRIAYTPRKRSCS